MHPEMAIGIILMIYIQLKLNAAAISIATPQKLQQ